MCCIGGLSQQNDVFCWAVSRGLAGCGVVGEEEPEVCLFWAEADDVAEGGGVVFLGRFRVPSAMLVVRGWR